MKKRLISSFLVAATLVCMSTLALAANYKYFPDVPDTANYAYEINFLREAGIFNGDEQGNFNPNKTMTRAEAATLMVRLFVGEIQTTPTTSSFTDVPSSHWAYGYIETAVQHGMISGYGNGKFGPSDELTYDQAVTLLVRALGYEDIAQELGGWPDGFIIVGDALEITEGTANASGKSVHRNVVAKLIFNSCYRNPDIESDENSNEIY